MSGTVWNQTKTVVFEAHDYEKTLKVRPKEHTPELHGRIFLVWKGEYIGESLDCAWRIYKRKIPLPFTFAIDDEALIVKDKE